MKTLNLAALALFAALLTACGGGSGATSGGLDGAPSGPSLRISITDAPFPSALVSEASVVIKEVRVRDKALDSWITVFSGNIEIDLVPLTGGVAAALVDAEVPPGTYDEVRLIVDAGRVILSASAFTATGDLEFTVANDGLKFPSGSQTGIKVKIDNDIVVTSELSGDLMLDFDLTKSFVFNGPPSHAPGVRRVLFKPVIRANNSSTAGSLRLQAMSDSATPADLGDDLPLPGATVRICDSDDLEVASVLADAQGIAEVSLEPGTYAVKVEAGAHETTTVEGIVVSLANLTDVGAVTLVVSEAEIKGAVQSDGGTPGDPTDDTQVTGATVEVRLAGDSAVVASIATDAQGAFVFDALAPGSYDLRVVSPGFEILDLGAVIAAGPGLFAPLDITLLSHLRDVTGTVVDNGAAAVAAATVEVRNVEGLLIGTATTGSAGEYTITNIPTGSHTITVIPNGSVTGHTEPLTVVGTNPTSAQTVDIATP